MEYRTMRLVKEYQLVIYPPPLDTDAQLPLLKNCRRSGHIAKEQHASFPLSLISQHSTPVPHNGQTSFRTTKRAGVGICRRHVPPFPVRLHQPRCRLLGLLLPRLGRHGDTAAIRRPKLCPVCLHPLHLLPPRPHRRRRPRLPHLRRQQIRHLVPPPEDPLGQVEALYPRPARLGAAARAPDVARLGRRHGLCDDAVCAPHQRRAGVVAVVGRRRQWGGDGGVERR
ncbi:hypothetical protein B0T18DRAFT_36150 [Schizothecium vesticola]|uniref:Uncharacterized protein n=1 Tax=Schizothecium vesticola TaxID=314040 RepID=A0AA40FAU9_9PEZI|nr:hypothetical protein B0T18DRAFT_36150 [Schizothecium vesticola]